MARGGQRTQADSVSRKLCQKQRGGTGTEMWRKALSFPWVEPGTLIPPRAEDLVNRRGRSPSVCAACGEAGAPHACHRTTSWPHPGQSARPRRSARGVQEWALQMVGNERPRQPGTRMEQEGNFHLPHTILTIPLHAYGTPGNRRPKTPHGELWAGPRSTSGLRLQVTEAPPQPCQRAQLPFMCFLGVGWV